MSKSPSGRRTKTVFCTTIVAPSSSARLSHSAASKRQVIRGESKRGLKEGKGWESRQNQAHEVRLRPEIIGRTTDWKEGGKEGGSCATSRHGILPFSVFISPGRVGKSRRLKQVFGYSSIHFFPAHAHHNTPSCVVFIIEFLSSPQTLCQNVQVNWNDSSLDGKAPFHTTLL